MRGQTERELKMLQQNEDVYAPKKQNISSCSADDSAKAFLREQ